MECHWLPCIGNTDLTVWLADTTRFIRYRCRISHLMYAVTLNVYTHIGLEDAEKELQKMQGLENARKEMGLSDKDDKPLKQNMFKVI